MLIRMTFSNNYNFRNFIDIRIVLLTQHFGALGYFIIIII